MSDRDDHHASETEPLSAEDLAWLQSVRRGQDRQRQVTLQLFHRDGVHEVLLAEGSGVVLGRDYPADEIVNDASLSREHAHVELLDGAVWVQDLGSTNGTWVDGERIEQRAQVALGQSLALGSVTAVIVPEEGARRGRARLDSHDRFVRSLDAEIERAHAFSRSLALLMIRGEDRRRGQLGSWLPAVRRKLRPFDQAALYSGDTLELLLPETTEEAARATAAALIQHSEPLVCGVAVFPGHASSAEELVDAARSAVQHAFGDEPIQAALPSHSVILTPDLVASTSGLIVRSSAMLEVYQTVDKLARSTIPVLILGETGTGKEVVAREIHRRGKRADHPMICVNCGGIPGNLVESTLFGHEKGAFTGAANKHQGVFEAADGGTVLLDEVGELPAAAQAALLRVLESKRITRVGSTAEIDVDVRVLAATHRDLDAMTESGEFRQDLLYRLNAMTLRVPPLRERPDEIEALARSFIEEANAANECVVRGLDEDAQRLLLQYSWPGNVRELRNAIERGVVLAWEGRIAVDDLPEAVRALEPRAPRVTQATQTDPLPLDQMDTSGGLRDQIQRYEIQLIIDAVRNAGGDRKLAAAALEMPVRTLNHKIKQYEIPLSAFE